MLAPSPPPYLIVSYYLVLDPRLWPPPTNRCKLVIQIRFIDHNGGSAAGVPVDGSDPAVRVLEVDLGPDAGEAVGGVVSHGDGEGGAREHGGSEVGHDW